MNSTFNQQITAIQKAMALLKAFQSNIRGFDSEEEIKHLSDAGGTILGFSTMLGAIKEPYVIITKSQLENLKPQDPEYLRRGIFASAENAKYKRTHGLWKKLMKQATK